jgi:hypothetical protein
MIIISLLGVDQYQAASYVKDIQDQIAQAFETEPENILFYAPDSFLIFRGIDQTSYQLNIEVEAPKKFMPLEEQATKVLVKIFSESHVHIRVLFKYFEEEHEHESINEEYPRFMTEQNMAHFENENDDSEDESGTPYMGDAFADYDAKVKAKEEEQQKEEAGRQSQRTDKGSSK